MRKWTVCSLLGAFLAAAYLGSSAAQQARKTFPPDIADKVALTDFGKVRTMPFPVAVQCWTFRKYGFLETLEKVKGLGIRNLQAYPGQPLGPAFPGAAFIHTMSDEILKAVQDRLREAGLSVVAYGVVDAGRTEADMRPVFQFARRMGIRTIVCEPQDGDFDALEKLVKEYNIRIAVHNHPAPAPYAHPMAALERVARRDERIGVCADTGHWMREGLKPVECLRLLEGRIVDLHLKDRSGFGKGEEAVDVAWGKGRANVRDILAEMTLQDYAGFLTVEYENEAEAATPEPAVRAGLDYVRGVTYYEGYTRILRRSGGRYEKHGWNHYGPGWFECDPATGVLKGQGGMGLLWYGKKVKDFILECEFKCSTATTNSGIFLRVPAVPVSDDYIYRAIEIQIDDTSEGIHHTGSAYDIKAPKARASRPAGEWNHFRIEFRGSRLKVELNGKLVMDWEAKPGGKVRDLAPEGYIGLQNHDSQSPPYFRNIYLKEL